MTNMKLDLVALLEQAKPQLVSVPSYTLIELWLRQAREYLISLQADLGIDPQITIEVDLDRVTSTDQTNLDHKS